MKAVVPAAGEGTRLRPLTRGVPKGMLRVGGRPILEHCLEALVRLSVEEVVLVLGEGGGTVRERFGRAFAGTPVAYARQEEPRGLADAVLAAAPRLGGEFVVMNGDNLFVDANLGDVVTGRRAEGLAASLLVERVPPGRARQGGCLVDEEGRLTGLVERPGPHERRAGLVAAGFFAFSPAILEACRRISPSARGELELTDAIGWLLERGEPVGLTVLEGRRVNVNTPADLAAAERLLAAAGSPERP